mmetsp:Transcript_43312/g.108221  ORF Transcript_43312/g.108221 Transcript_43312/m.108221 type:complete len:208 (+) Transcript_43312:483-1106(+)
MACEPAVLLVKRPARGAVDEGPGDTQTAECFVHVFLELLRALWLCVKDDLVEPPEMQPLLDLYRQGPFDGDLALGLLHIAAVERLVEEELDPSALVEVVASLLHGILQKIRQGRHLSRWAVVGAVDDDCECQGGPVEGRALPTVRQHVVTRLAAIRAGTLSELRPHEPPGCLDDQPIDEARVVAGQIRNRAECVGAFGVADAEQRQR